MKTEVLWCQFFVSVDAASKPTRFGIEDYLSRTLVSFLAADEYDQFQGQGDIFVGPLC